MALLTQNIAIDQGATLRQYFTYCSQSTPAVIPIDITGYTARMQLRTSPSATTIKLSLVDTASANGQIILGTVDGSVQIYITDTATALLSGGGVYDLELVTPTGDVVRFLQGSYSVSPNVTR